MLNYYVDFNIVATLFFKDDADFLPKCLNNLVKQGVTTIIAGDNGSTDNSREIVLSFPEVKEVIVESGERIDLVTKMAVKAIEYKPTWIIHVDADELWHSIESLRIESSNELLKAEKIFVHLPVRDLSFHVINHKAFRAGLPKSIPKVIHRPKANIRVDGYKANIYDEKAVDYLSIHHFPIRSLEQFKRKAPEIYKGKDLDEVFSNLVKKSEILIENRDTSKWRLI